MTPIDQYIGVLNRLHPISPAYEHFLRKSVTIRLLKPKEHFLPLGHHASVFCFVAKGLIYSYQLNRSGDLIPTHFALENQFLGTVRHPLYPEQISDGIMCLDESVLVTGKVSLAAEAVRRFAEARDLIDITVNEANREYQRLQAIRLLHSPEERVENFKAFAPGLFNRVNQKLIATYLNMSRVYFNQLKNKR